MEADTEATEAVVSREGTAEIVTVYSWADTDPAVDMAVNTVVDTAAGMPASVLATL